MYGWSVYTPTNLSTYNDRHRAPTTSQITCTIIVAHAPCCGSKTAAGRRAYAAFWDRVDLVMEEAGLLGLVLVT